ncbi:4Fe-4S binding protein, partial [bacterium]|nr:4Fe-4S binding protein [bacterium]
EAGASEITEQVVERQLDYVVLAACRCCNLEQVCYSCTDRRALCQKYLDKFLILPHNTVVEFVNIREQCAWAHRDDPQGATRKAVQIISSGIARVKLIKPVAPLKRSILPGALIIGGETTGVSAATALASLGFQVELLSRGKCGNGGGKPSEIAQSMAGMDGWEGVTVKPWPETMELHGTAGNYEAVLKYGSQVDHIETGAVLVDVQEINEQTGSMIRTTPSGGLLGRIISRKGSSGLFTDVADDYLREVTIGDLSGVFLIPPDGSKSSQEQVFRGLASAARVSTFLKQASISPRITAVEIDTKLCRGCGDCANLCHYIEMKEQRDGTFYASVDKALWLGCGACVAICPTGAITQPFQSDKQIVSTVRSMILPSKKLVKV